MKFKINISLFNLIVNVFHCKLNIPVLFENFINNMRIGDRVYLCRGANQILYSAIIDSDYIFDNSDYESVSTHATTYNQIKNGWFWRHLRKIKDITPVNLTTNIDMRQTIHKRFIQ